MIASPAALSADDCLAEIRRLYGELKTIWTARTHTHEQQTALMAEIRTYADRYRLLERGGRVPSHPPAALGIGPKRTA